MPDPIRIVLTSDLFRDNERLQRAASDHRHHVMLGDEGEHVRRIQMFLVWYVNVPEMVKILYERKEIGSSWWSYGEGLAFYEMFQAETTGALYGPRTEDLVRAFKQGRDIVDRSRQTRADGIVGIRTVREMDRVASNGKPSYSPGALDRQGTAPPVSHAMKPVLAAGPTVGARMLRRVA